MSQKIPNIECIFHEKGICYHDNAPKVMFMRPKCILIQTKDPRIVKQCNLQQNGQVTLHMSVPLLNDQEPLGLEFEAVWDAHVDSLYEN